MVIRLAKAVKKLPEGIQVLKIDNATYNADFGKLQLFYVNKDGCTGKETFSFIKQSGETNEGALNSFSYKARAILDDFDAEEIDHEDLIGRYFRCKVGYNEGGYLEIKDCTSATGFDDSTSSVNLDTIFDD